MKRLILSTILAMAFSVANADNFWCSGSEGFGGPYLKFTNVGNSQQVILGGGGGGFITPNVFWGGAGYGTVSNSQTINISDNGSIRKTELDMGYGGFMVGHVKPITKYLKWESQLLLGFGGFTLSDGNFEADQSFFIAEPEVNFFVSPSEWFHIGVGAGYRFANVSNGYVSNSMFNKPTFNLKFNFGKL